MTIIITTRTAIVITKRTNNDTGDNNNDGIEKSSADRADGRYRNSGWRPHESLSPLVYALYDTTTL